MSRFPGFGSYNRAARLTDDIGKTPLEVRNANDDVAALADHLHVAAWLWRNASWQAGLWYLQESHRRHWGEPMRHLQLYLHVRDAQRSDEP